MKTKDGRDMIGFQEVAELIGISLSTVRRYCDRGLPYHQVVKGRTCRWFDMREVMAWMEKNH